MSIRENWEKIKGAADMDNLMERNAFVGALLVLVSLISFGLGRLSGLETVNREVNITFPTGQTASALIGTFATSSVPAVYKTSGTYLASKNGTKYYLQSCSSSKRISAANRIWFDTKQEAEAAGYAPAANCAGM